MPDFINQRLIAMTMNLSNDKYFNTRICDTTLILDFNHLLLLENESYEHKENFLALLDDIEQNPDIRTLVINNNHSGFSLEKYEQKWNSFFENTEYESHILRVFRTFNEFFLRIKAMHKAVISMNSLDMNPLLFNFSLAADLRCISSGFAIHNNNLNMVNIAKGGAVYDELRITNHNPFKLIFLLEKITAKSLYKRHIVDRVYQDDLEGEVLKIASHLSSFDYLEIEVIKMITQSKLQRLEKILQRENEFLLTCIRKKQIRENAK
jgi:enoyl-CoA hydratase/carnithine racemase